MLGIVIWTNEEASSSLIYCSDGQDLAYVDGKAMNAAEVGSLVRVDLESGGKGLRKCTDVRALGLAASEDLVDVLKTKLRDGHEDANWLKSVDLLISDMIDPASVANDQVAGASRHLVGCGCPVCS